MITSKNNGQLKNVKKLMESPKERREKKLFVIEGLRLVNEAPVSQVECLYVSETMERSGKIDLSRYRNIEVVSDEVFNSFSGTVTPQGVMAVVKMPEYEFRGGAEKATLLILDDIQDPGNLGTMMRTAEAAGVSGVIMSPGCVDIYNPKVIRSTMGSIFRVPFVICDLVPEIENLKMDGYAVYGAALDGASFYTDVEYPDKRAVVIGNEGRGISESVLNSVSEKIKIPMEGKVESLNAAVSAAVIVFYLYNLSR